MFEFQKLTRLCGYHVLSPSLLKLDACHIYLSKRTESVRLQYAYFFQKIIQYDIESVNDVLVNYCNPPQPNVL